MKQLYKLASMLLALALLLSGCAVGTPEAEGPPQFCAVINGEEISYEIYAHYFNTYVNDYFNAYYDNHLAYYALDLLDEEEARATLARLERYAWETNVQAALLRQLARDDYGIELPETYLSELLTPGYAQNLELNRYYLALHLLLAEQAQAELTLDEAAARALYDEDPAAWNSRRAVILELSTDGQVRSALRELTRGRDFLELTGARETGLFLADGAPLATEEGEQIAPELAAAVFALARVGEYTEDAVELADSYYLVQLLERRENFSAVKEAILQQERQATAEDISDYIYRQLAVKEADSTIECLLEFRYAQPEADANFF